MENEEHDKLVELQEYVGHNVDEEFTEDDIKKPKIAVFSDGRGGVYQQYVFDFIEDQVAPI